MTRWYDRFNSIDELIDLTAELPYVLQRDIGTHLNNSAEYYKTWLNDNTALKSIGSQAIMSLYKSKRKQRWYDQLPSFHEAVNTMQSGVPEAGLQKINHGCSKLVSHIKQLHRHHVTDPARMALAVEDFLTTSPLVIDREAGGYLQSPATDEAR